MEELNWVISDSSISDVPYDNISVDKEVNMQLLLDEIIKYRRNNVAVHKSDAFVETSTGNRRRKMTTKGW